MRLWKARALTRAKRGLAALSVRGRPIVQVVGDERPRAQSYNCVSTATGKKRIDEGRAVEGKTNDQVCF